VIGVFIFHLAPNIKKQDFTLKCKFLIRYFGLFLSTILFLSNCTENPFFDDKIEVKENREIKGTALLNDGTAPEGIYIWLESFNVATFTDEDGKFKIELPQAQAQPGGGLNGVFNLYYYVANYEVLTSSILVVDGEIEYEKGDVNSNGVISETKVLTKILDIGTTVTPADVRDDHKDFILFTVRLKNLVDTVAVGTYYNVWGTPSSLVIKHIDSPIEESILIQGTPGVYRKTVIDSVTTWKMSYAFSPNFFNGGTYQIIPYVRIYQKELPDELLRSIDEDIFEFNYKYLKWPLKQRPGKLQVQEFSG